MIKVLKSRRDWWCLISISHLRLAFGRPCYCPRWFNVCGINVTMVWRNKVVF